MLGSGSFPPQGKLLKRIRLLSTAIGLLSVSVACSSGNGRMTVAAPPTSVPAPPQPQIVQPIDPVRELLATADRHFEAGRNELAVGHLARAKARFNEALEVLLESPQGARGDARIRDHFELLVDRIAALELTALATGDGFTE
jgi:hypothetical protein